MASNNAHKKMSLEEFLGDDSLGDSVWNEDDINLEAINNNTDIELLKKTKKDIFPASPSSSTSSSSHGPPPLLNRSDEPQYAIQGPPYIVKFSHLPPKFADLDIQDLFQAKFTKFIKFKMFWELNTHPTIDTLKNGTIFEQNFKKDAKVSFVELYTGRDMDKVLKFWSAPLWEIYQIKLEAAKFDDFKNYMAKAALLKAGQFDDPAKSYQPPPQKKAPKPNPFGAAKPVDTQSKLLDLEEKMSKFHVEDTTTLRRLSGNDGPVPQLKHCKVTLLKKPVQEDTGKQNTEQPKPLSYVQVLQKSVEETKAANPLSSSSPTPMSITPTIQAQAKLYSEKQGRPPFDEDRRRRDSHSTNFEDSTSNADAFSEQDRSNSINYNRNSRGNFNRGGGRFHRGQGYNRGNNRGNHSNTQYRQNINSNNNHNNNDNDNDRAPYPRRQNQSSHQHEEEKRYSLFRPASGFLQEGDNNDKAHNGGKYNKGGNHARGGGRGGFGHRHRRGFS